jgi:uncharacterized protein (TIGR00369 family)
MEAPAGFEQRVAAAFARQGFMGLLGARLVSVEPGRCAIELPFRQDLTQHHGFFHAGTMTTLADNACGFAAMTLAPARAEILSVEFKISFLRPGAGVAVLARGEVIRPGRSLATCRADVWARREDGEEVLAATMLATMAVVAEPGTSG